MEDNEEVIVDDTVEEPTEDIVEDVEDDEPIPVKKTENGFIEEIIEDLTDELQDSDEDFKSNVLISKIRQAYREVKSARKYPSTYTEDMIVNDIENYYANIRNIAIYDYNQVGGEFEKSHNESSISRTWVERSELFSGIYPLAKTNR